MVSFLESLVEPIGRGRLKEEIDEAIVEFIDTGEELILEVKGDSVCHFFQRFSVGDDEIQLRLDWSDIAENSHPVLDADFYSSETGKKLPLKGSRLDSHHTNTVTGKGREYIWSYKDCTRPFKVKVRWLARAEFKCSFSMTAEATVIKGNKS